MACSMQGGSQLVVTLAVEAQANIGIADDRSDLGSGNCLFLPLFEPKKSTSFSGSNANHISSRLL